MLAAVVVVLASDVSEAPDKLDPTESPDDPLELEDETTPVDVSVPGTHSSARPMPASEPNRLPDGHAASSKLQYPGASQNPACPPTLHSASSAHANTDEVEQLQTTSIAVNSPTSQRMGKS